MTTPEQPSLARRHRNLPGDLALALVNATALLIIVAAVLVIVAVGRVEMAGARLAGAAAEATFGRLGIDPAGLQNRLAGLEEEIAALRQELQSADGSALAPLERSVDALTNAAIRIGDQLEGIGETGPQLLETAIRAGGAALGESLADLAGCTLPGPPSAQSRHPLVDQMAPAAASVPSASAS